MKKINLLSHLSSFKVESKDEHVRTKLNLRSTLEGNSFDFIKDFLSEIEPQSLSYLVSPIIWKTINLETPCKVEINFDEITIDANLLEIKIRRNVKEDFEQFVFDFVFSKEQEEFDLTIMSYLKQKEEDENGRQKIVNYSTSINLKEIYPRK